MFRLLEMYTKFKLEQLIQELRLVVIDNKKNLFMFIMSKHTGCFLKRHLHNTDKMIGEEITLLFTTLL